VRPASGARVSAPSTVIHRERTPIRDAKGRISFVHESERVETVEEHAKHAAAINAEAQRQADELPKQVANMAAEIDRSHARINELQQQLVDERAAHAAELDAIRGAVVAAAQRQIAHDEQFAADMGDPESEIGRALASIAAHRDDNALYQLPSDLVNVAALRTLEHDLRDAGIATPIRWVLTE
jgi:alanyl-tRNA synthetase